VGWLQPRFSLACGATSDLKIALGYAKARLNDVELRQGTAVVIKHITTYQTPFWMVLPTGMNSVGWSVHDKIFKEGQCGYAVAVFVK
jgi:hypothetical protein